MIIKKIRLQNIKSYVDSEISFHRGVNFISGVNGAGKSTIIESIGYALFNHNPYSNIKELIRYGHKSGIITVDFMANDDRDYRVVRKIGTSTLWAVYDLETDSLLQQGVKDVLDWLKEVMGIAEDLDLGQLFRDIIGVSQGTFVAPFLETEAERKRKFDGILRVEQYREAFINTSKAVAILNREIGDKETDLRIMADQVKDYQVIKDGKEELEKMLAQLKTKITQMATDIKNKSDALNKFEELKNKLDKIQSDLQSAERADKLLLEKRKMASEYLQKAREALSLVTSSEEGYKAFIALEEELKHLEKQKSEQEQLEKELNQVNQKIIGLKAQIAEQEKSLSQQQKEIKSNRENNLATVQNLEKEMTTKKEELAKLKSAQGEISKWYKGEEKSREIKKQLEDLQRAAIADNEKSAIIKEEIKSLKEQLASYDKTKLLADQRNQREKLLEETRTNYRALKERLKITLENSAQLKEGLCPFLSTNCPNINQQTDFTDQINLMKNQLAGLEKRGNDLKIQFDEAQIAKEKIEVLQVHKKRLEQLQEQLEKLSKNQNNLFRQCDDLPVGNVLLDLQAISGQSFNKLNEVQSALGKLNTLVSSNEGIAKLEEVLASLDNIMDESKNKREDRENIYSEKELNISGGLSKLTADYNNAQNSLQQLAKKESNLKQLESDIAENRKFIGTLESQAVVYKDKLKLFTDISRELASNKEQQKKYRQHYETYRQNELEAKKLPTTEADLARVENEITVNRDKIEQLNKTRKQLSQEFDQKQYLQAKEELDLLKQEAAREKQINLERTNDLSEHKKRLGEIEKIMVRMDKVKAEIEFNSKKSKILDIIRNILNKAGPSVARIYLENLSREANELYRQVSRDSVSLEWQKGYEIMLIDNYQGQSRMRSFKQFSGGEQMTAALAVRLALLKQQSSVKLGFFDEPTANLDSGRRNNLAETIPKVTGGFEQLFVISHDDTFDEITENIIQLQKDENKGTNLLS